METIATIIAGLVLAGAATAGIVVTQGGGPSGTAPVTNPSNLTAIYGSGK